MANFDHGFAAMHCQIEGGADARRTSGRRCGLSAPTGAGPSLGERIAESHASKGLKAMTRTSPWVLILALAVSACGNDAGGGDSNGGAVNAVAAETAGNASAGSQAAQAGGSATPSRRAPVPPSGAATTLVGMPRGVPLGPILDEDYHSEGLMGCTCMFHGREGMYLSVLDGELMVRTPAGRQLCPITDPQLQSLGEPGGEVSCAGVRMSIRETGARVAEIASDSSSGPAILSATQDDGVTGTLDGTWGCAC
jgi:hypothetical protein